MLYFDLSVVTIYLFALIALLTKNSFVFTDTEQSTVSWYRLRMFSLASAEHDLEIDSKFIVSFPIARYEKEKVPRLNYRALTLFYMFEFPLTTMCHIKGQAQPWFDLLFIVGKHDIMSKGISNVASWRYFPGPGT